MPAIADGHKYACIALTTGMSALSPTETVTLAPGVVATRTPPVGLPTHWREWLGAIEARDLDAGDLFITATAPSARPEVLDGENEMLRHRARRHMTGLWIVTPGLRITHARDLSGAAHKGDVDLRATQQLDMVFCSPGTPAGAVVGRPQLGDAAAVARGLDQTRRLAGTEGYGDFARVRRALNALYNCIRSPQLDHRLHQAVRVLEALLVPGKGATGDHLAKRAPRFLGSEPRYTELLRTLYTLRSKVEHLYGPVAAVRLALPGEPAPDELTAFMWFARATYTAEFIARGMLTRVLGTPALWPHFSSEDQMARFWTDEDPARWGPLLGGRVTAVMRSFDEQAARRAFDDSADEQAVRDRAAAADDSGVLAAD